MYRALAEHRSSMRQGRTLAISYSGELCSVLGLDSASVLEANYPQYDMRQLPFEDESFANVVSDQVLEHVRGNPKSAIDEAFRLLEPGGVAVHTTCFINPVHDHPGDYWRFTPEALRLLCNDSEVLGAGGWGNKYVWLVDALGMRFDPVPHSKRRLLHKLATLDDPDWPIVTWIVARKPS